jgi:ketosteroid isomerase-like protein
MADADGADVALDELVHLMSEAASAYIGGEMKRYFDLMNHADDFTLMGPFGGETTRESVASEERIAELERLFKGGEATLEVIERYASGDLAVLVVVERQQGLVGDYPPQDWSLRVTLVLRREASGWRLVHRHADPLVHAITFDRVAELARGGATDLP